MIKNNLLKGSSLLELVIYLLISSIVMSEIARNLVSSYKIYKNTKVETKADLKIKRVEAFLFKESLRDEIYFGIKKYIFHNNSKSFFSKYSGPEIPKLQIHTDSAVLESTNLIPSLFYKNSHNTEYTGIINIKDISNRQSLRFIGVNLTQLILYDQNYSLNLIGRNTWSLNIKNSNKNSFKILSLVNNNQQIKDSNYYIPELVTPIQDYFIIYTDSNNSLRRYSILTKSNQPIEEGILFKKLNPETCEIKLTESLNKNKNFTCIGSNVKILETVNLLDG